MEIFVKFGGGRVVETEIEGQVVRTDVPEKAGGSGSAPSASGLFLASIGLCAAYYVREFCEKRNIPTGGVSVTMGTFKNEKTRLLDRIRLDIKLPPEFPEKYESAVVRAADQCWVKKQIQAGTEFETNTVR